MSSNYTYRLFRAAAGVGMRRSSNPIAIARSSRHFHYWTTTTTTSQAFNNNQASGVVPFVLQQQQQQQDSNNYYGNAVLWPLRKPDKGTGFDNFLKRGGGTKEEDKDGNNNNKKDNNDDNKRYSSSGGDNNNNNNNGSIAVLIGLMLGATLILGSSSDKEGGDESGNGGRGSQHREQNASSSTNNNVLPHLDLSWSEFLQLLEQDQIFKIVIHQGANTREGEGQHTSSRARVYLKPGAPLRPHKQHTSDDHEQHGDWSADREQNMEDHTEWNNNTTSTNDGDTTTAANNNKTPLPYRNLRIGSATSLERKLEEAQRALGRSPQHDVPVQYQVESGITHELMGIVPWVLLSAFMIASMRGAAGRMGGVGATGSSGQGGMFGMGKSTAQKFTKEMNLNVNFKSVAGCDEAKKEIMEFVEFLQNSDKFTQLGAKIPKGALLCGPPGTGKTLLAKAVAGEAGVPFYTLAGSEFLEMFVGVGPSRVRDLFKEARESSPCIIFIDEIDSIGRKRGKSSAMGGNDERENTLNQLLVEMDGFDPSAGVIVLAGTNRDDVLDPALTRPGRFDRKIQVDLPDIQGRKDIFKVHLRNITLVEGFGAETLKAKSSSSQNDGTTKDNQEDDNNNNTDDDENKNSDSSQDDEVSPEQKTAIDNVASRLAGLTPGFSGADIANICNEAAIVAARRNADSVTMEDFEKATDRVIGGLESNRIMSTEERNIVAYHEAGHAVAGWFLEHADPLLKVTIIPRASGALGFAQYLPKEVHLRTQDQIMDIVCMALAGRAAEEVFFGSVTTGASDDLRRVTQMVYSTIQMYGMNDRLGQLAYPKDPNAMWDERKYSEKTAKAMDEEAKRIVDAAYERTLNLMREKKDQVDMVAKTLLEKESINHDQIMDLIGARPFKGDKNYEEYVSRRKEDKQQGTDNKKDGEVTGDDAAPNLTPSF